MRVEEDILGAYFYLSDQKDLCTAKFSGLHTNILILSKTSAELETNAK